MVDTSNGATAAACATMNASANMRSIFQLSALSPQPFVTVARKSVYFFRPLFCTHARRLPSIDHAGGRAAGAGHLAGTAGARADLDLLELLLEVDHDRPQARREPVRLEAPVVRRPRRRLIDWERGAALARDDEVPQLHQLRVPLER